MNALQHVRGRAGVWLVGACGRAMDLVELGLQRMPERPLVVRKATAALILAVSVGVERVLDLAVRLLRRN